MCIVEVRITVTMTSLPQTQGNGIASSWLASEEQQILPLTHVWMLRVCTGIINCRVLVWGDCSVKMHLYRASLLSQLPRSLIHALYDKYMNVSCCWCISIRTYHLLYPRFPFFVSSLSVGSPSQINKKAMHDMAYPQLESVSGEHRNIRTSQQLSLRSKSHHVYVISSTENQ